MGWRRAFITVGLPGLGLALLVALCAREPKRGGLERRGLRVAQVEEEDENWSAGWVHVCVFCVQFFCFFGALHNDNVMYRRETPRSPGSEVEQLLASPSETTKGQFSSDDDDEGGKAQKVDAQSATTEQQQQQGAGAAGELLSPLAVLRLLVRRTAFWHLTLAKVKKRHFLSHLYIKTMILPRQARDKQRESTQKKCRFRAGAAALRCDRILCVDADILRAKG